jgi:ADP-ribose pyrophosphatase YjhB (NUDIX family)
MGARAGCSLGVSGAVLLEDRVLLVRRLFEPYRGWWTMPSGYVEQDESLDEAVMREVIEETGLSTEVIGVAGLRNRVSPGDNNVMVIFRLKPLSTEPHPDGVEVDRAEFVPVNQALAADDVIPIARMALRSILARPDEVFYPGDCPPTPGLPSRVYRGWVAVV